MSLPIQSILRFYQRSSICLSPLCKEIILWLLD